MPESKDMELNVEYCPKCKHKEIIKINWNMSNTFYVLFIVTVLILGVWFGRYEARQYREMVYEMCQYNPYFDAEEYTIDYTQDSPFGIGQLPKMPLAMQDNTIKKDLNST